MKKVIFGLILSFLFTTGYSQNKEINKFFNKLSSTDGYSVVKVEKEMFQLLAAMNTEINDQELKDLMDGLNEITVLINEKGGGTDDYSKFMGIVESTSLKSFMSFKEEGSNVNLYSSSITDDGKLNGIVLSVQDGDETIFINVDGVVNLSALGKLTKDLDIGGLNHLKDYDEKRQ